MINFDGGTYPNDGMYRYLILSEPERFVGKRMEKIKKMIASWQATMILLGLYAVAMAAATFIEAGMGTAMAKAIVYYSWWFFALHVLLIANFVAVSVRLRLFQRRRWGSLMLHYGFAVAIVGAFVTHVWGYEGYMHIREGETADAILIDNKIEKKVPFSVTLKDFILVRYPGSHSPSSYESDVVIDYEGTSREQKIYMNNIARVGGFRIYQTSYDQDEKGTILTVNSDRWGTNITYAGYLLLLLGLVGALVQKGSRFRTLFASIGKTAAVALLFCGTVFSASAQQSTAAIREVDAKRAERFGKLLIQSPDGRIEPVNTYSSEILRKLYHRDKFRGMNPDQVLIGLIGDPYGWGHTPIIYISVPEVARAVGAQGKHISFQDMFDQEGEYKIMDIVSKAYQKQPNERTKADKEYMKLDEKVNILFQLFNGGMMPVFPTDDGRWLSSGDATDELQRMDSMFVKRVLPWYANLMTKGEYGEADKVMAMLETYQKAKTAHLEIDPKKIEAEIFYNKADIFRYAFRLYLILGFLLMLGVISTLWKHDPKLQGRQPGYGWWITALTVAIAGVFLYQTLGLGLRWYISGRAPWTNAYESIVYVGWTTVLAGLIFARRSRLVLALATLLGGVILFVSNLNWLDPQITPLVPVLKSYWLMIHVSVITASYGFFGMCAMCGLTSLIALTGGKRLPELRKINELSMNIGLVLLTAGIFFGAVWANESWGRYWGWDPKETWALITMVVYAMITHSHFIPRVNNDYAFAAMSLGAISTVLMTFFGVNYYLSGLHSYGGSGEVSFTLAGIAAVVIILLILAAGYRHKKIKLAETPEK